MHSFTCPHCGTEFEFPDEQAGGVVTCLGCGRGVALPKRPSANEPRPRTAQRRRTFWTRLISSRGWLAVGLILVATGFIWASVFTDGEAPIAPVAMMIAGFAVILLWFMGYYISVAIERGDGR